MLTNPCEKYSPYPPIALPDRRWPERQITTAPRWLSTDLRDGNQMENACIGCPISIIT